MNHLHQGDVLEIRYCPSDRSDPAVKLSTRIMHITKTRKALQPAITMWDSW